MPADALFKTVCVSVFTAPGQVLELEAEFLFEDTDFNSINRMWDLEINITWAEPMFLNGEIDSYNVTVFETDNPSTEVFSHAALTTTSVTAPVMVPAFTNYTVTVAASTSAGQGEESTIIVESPEAGI